MVGLLGEPFGQGQGVGQAEAVRERQDAAPPHGADDRDPLALVLLDEDTGPGH